MTDEMIYRSCRQGGMRYDGIAGENGEIFTLDFEDGLYMPATPIWDKLKPGIKFRQLNLEEIFGNANPLFVEIGMGNGEFTAHYAGNNPDQNWFGFEVFHKVFEKAVRRCKRASHGNIRIFQFDAELFVRLLPEKSVSGFYVNFPDPWPKAKHTKRRLLKPWFMELMSSRLTDNGSITVATDHDDYANEITENFAQVASLESALGVPLMTDMGDYYKTKYYRKFAEQANVYFYVMIRRQNAQTG